MKNIEHTVRAFAGAIALALAGAAQAGPVVSLGVSRDAGSAVFFDAASGREWLGAELTKSLTYDQTLAAIGQGGQFAGYTLAHHADVLQLLGAMTGGSCSVQAAYCTVQGSANAKAVYGENYYTSFAWGYDYDYDYGFFVSDSGDAATAVGLLEVYTTAGTSTLTASQAWTSVASADQYAGADYGVGWMLYRDVNAAAAVPEPGSLALAALAVLGLAITRRRRCVFGR